MIMTLRSQGSSLRRQLLFWWILFVVLQSAERIFLLREAVEAESPSPAMLVQTLLVGLRGDFIVGTIALALASVVGIMPAVLRKGASVVRRCHDLLALYQASNAVLDQIRIWSWMEYGHRL
ncbi:MAG TPA: hypothetical protein VJ805_11425 [Nitrospiraceae bacterium]|nr:hypothetical protein [Nitrospiraceae bacterium]